MKVLAKSRGVVTEHEIPEEVKVLVSQPAIKVSCPDAYQINIDTTIKTMKEMSQQAWEHISTGELFIHLYTMLFHEDTYLPPTIQEFLDEDRACIHGAGLIVQLVESRFEGRTKVFLHHPEDGLHPKQLVSLMSVVEPIRKIPLGGLDNDMEVVV